jgi:hypothetical protein
MRNPALCLRGAGGEDAPWSVTGAPHCYRDGALGRQWVADWSPMGRRLVANGSPIGRQWVADWSPKPNPSPYDNCRMATPASSRPTSSPEIARERRGGHIQCVRHESHRRPGVPD